MIVNLYCYYDKLAGSYGTPFVASNHELAKRTAKIELSKVNPEIANDIDLYFLCGYATDTGELQVYEKPQFICHYLDLKGGEVNE